MKIIILYISIIVVLMGCSEDFLKESPKAISIETYYKTVEEIEGALFAAYEGMALATAKTTSSMVLINTGEVDYAEGRVSFARYSDFKGELIADARIPTSWANAYTGIRNANLVILNTPNADVDESAKNSLIAEAKFVRSFIYFQLVRNWGGVPIRDLDNNTDPDVPKSSAEDVYEFLLKDLEEAEQYLPEDQEMAGRATKYAAKAMLADVYMHLDRWADARSKSLEVIESGKFSLVKVESSDDFYKIFGPEVNKSSEEIFYIKGNGTRGTYFCNYRHHPSVPYFKGGSGAYAKYTDSVNNRVIKEWDFKDLRKSFNLYNADIGIGSTTMLFKKYIDPNTAGAARNDWPAYRYTDVLLMYAEADCRVSNGPSEDGMEKLNMIHRRAYGQDPNSKSNFDFTVSDYNMETFVDLVIKEGMYEQMDEGKRIFTLKRTGKLAQAIKYARDIDLVQTHLLWPIPTEEFLYNGAMSADVDQNPGY